MKKSKNKIKIIFFLNILLLLYSFSTICSKKAGQYDLLSREFIFYYLIIIILLGIYAIGWQQVIKRIPLTSAFANKAITVVWGLVWGVLFFKEQITPGKALGALLVVLGVIVFAFSDREKTDE